MATSTQANFDSIKDADAHAQGLDGGLNLKTDPSRLNPPATSRADNAWHNQPGTVNQLPAFASSMQANTQHVYNIHARDLQQPSATGDVMLHGEVLDAPGSTTNRFTSPVWSDGNGTTINTAQPCLPANLRTRVLTGRQSIAGDATTDQANMMMARQEAGFTAASPQRYALAYHDGTNLNVTFGLVDGQIETPETLTVASTCDYCEIIGLQNSSNWAFAFLSGSTLKIAVYDFKGNQVTAATQIGSTVLSTTATASGYFAPISFLQHAGRTYLTYITNVSGSACAVTLYDVLSAASTSPISTSAVPTNGFAVCSPYPMAAPTGTFFLAILFNNNVYVCAQTSVGGAWSTVGQTGALATASSTGYVSGKNPAGRVDFTATMQVCAFDGAGTGTAASLGITVFRHYPEQVTAAPNSNAFWYQSVSVDRVSFQANATTATSTGTITSLGQNVFRTPSGAALCSKAFQFLPGEAKGAGLSSAKNAYVLVRCGASEPQFFYNGRPEYFGTTSYYWSYGQPTYFVLDHMGRVVGRANEGLAPQACGYTLANNQYYFVGPDSGAGWGQALTVRSLNAPLYVAPNSDLSILDVVLPSWVMTNGSATSYNVGGRVYPNAQPANIIMQPQALTFSVSGNVSQCPAVQGGPYSVLSGAMTCVHDGRGVVEANYHFATHNLFLTVNSSTTAGAGTAGTYYWSVVWEWYDSLGRVHRSNPSAPMPGVIASGSYLTSATVYVPQPVTTKSAVGGVMYARLYRSSLNNTDKIFYLVSTTGISALAGGNLFATLQDNGTYFDVSRSTASPNAPQISAQPRLYLQVLSDSGTVTFASTQPPAFLWQIGSKGRAFGLAQVSGQQRLYYSSVASGTVPFEWNALNYIAIPPDLGDVRSLEAIDDKIVLFGTRQNAVMNGDGPAAGNTTGVPTPGDGFALQPIPTPVGIVGTGSPAKIPDGIMFQGYSGIQLLGRDLGISPVGAAVDAITGRQVNNPGTVFGKAVTLASLQSVVWANPQGSALVYNYLTQKWAQWPHLSNASAILQRLDGTVCVALQPVSGQQYTGLATASNNGADYGALGATWSPLFQGRRFDATLVLESPWILPSGESGGESNVWDITVTGGYLGPHVLRVEQAYDYASSYTATSNFTVTQAPQNYQFRCRPKGRARCISVRYRISLLPISFLTTNYLMASLGDLVLDSGNKQGTSRLGAAFVG